MIAPRCRAVCIFLERAINLQSPLWENHVQGWVADNGAGTVQVSTPLLKASWADPCSSSPLQCPASSLAVCSFPK
jgi:hypothetical protein